MGTQMRGYPNEFLFSVSGPADGTQPSNTFGVAVTPAQNAYGSYAQIIAAAAVTEEIWEVEIRIENVGINAAARDCLVDIGVDPAGGSSYTSIIPDLVCGPANTLSAGVDPGFPVYYKFPIRVPSGASVAARAAVNSATLTAINVAITLRGKPTRPKTIRRGAFVRAFGVTAATSSGTAITPGTTSEGAWTLIGTAAETLWFWDFGYGMNTAAGTDGISFVDIGIGDGSNKRVVIYNAEVIASQREIVKKLANGRAAVAANGDGIYARMQTAGATTNQSIAVYGVGG